jgi:hypothetical protein
VGSTTLRAATKALENKSSHTKGVILVYELFEPGWIILWY